MSKKMLVLLILTAVLCVFPSIHAGAPTCPAGTVPPHDGNGEAGCYLFVNQSMSFQAAESYCQQQKGHLVVVNDVFTDMYLALKAHDAFLQATTFWIGARIFKYSSYNIWLWTRLNSIVQYTNWKSGVDSGTSPAVGSCASVTIDDITWSSVSCNQSLPFVCEVPVIVDQCAPQKCADGYTHFNETGMCYKTFVVNGTYVNMTRAEANCVADGGHLASIHSQTENTFVSLLAPGWSQSDYSMYPWIGLLKKTGGQAWTDGTPYDYQNWQPGDGNRDFCGFLLSGESGPNRMKWGDAFCSTLFGRFICKKAILS